MPASNRVAGAACHAANGALATKFTYNLNYLTNVGTTDAYVICHLPADDASSNAEQLVNLAIDVVIPEAGRTVTGMAQTGCFSGGYNHIQSSAAKSHTATETNDSQQLLWTNPGAICRSGVAVVLTINCKLPPGTKMGLIQHWVASVT